MTGLRLLAGAMTGVTIGVTLWEAAFGDNYGVVAFGTIVSMAGIWLIALTTEEDEHEKDNRHRPVDDANAARSRTH